MFLLCELYSKGQKAQPGQSGQRSTDEVERTEKIPVGAKLLAPFQTDPGAHSAFYMMVTGCLSWG